MPTAGSPLPGYSLVVYYDHLPKDVLKQMTSWLVSSEAPLSAKYIIALILDSKVPTHVIPIEKVAPAACDYVISQIPHEDWAELLVKLPEDWAEFWAKEVQKRRG